MLLDLAVDLVEGDLRVAEGLLFLLDLLAVIGEFFGEVMEGALLGSEGGVDLVRFDGESCTVLFKLRQLLGNLLKLLAGVLLALLGGLQRSAGLHEFIFAVLASLCALFKLVAHL